MSKEREVDYFFGVTVGALLGIALALLFVPRSGQETRELVKGKVITARDKAAQSSGKVRHIHE
jgi:gas vesicle protein